MTPISIATDESRQILARTQGVLQRRKRIIALCLLGVLLPILYYNRVAPRVYEATTTVIFDELDSPIDVGDPQTSRDILLLNRIQEIGSRALAEGIARALPDSIVQRFPLRVPLPPGAERLDKVASALHKGIAAYPVRNSAIVGVRVRLTDPELCVRVANLAISVLEERSYRARLEGVSGVRKFVSEQVDVYSKRLERSEQDLKRFKEQNRITSFDAEAKETLKRVTETEVLYNSVLTDRQAAEQRLKTLAAARGQRKNELLGLQADVESYKAKERALLEILTGYQEALEALPEQEFHLARLTRGRDANQKIYAMLLEKREEYRISEAERLPNIRVIDRAELPKQPISPRSKLNLALGGILGLLLGVGFGFLIEGTSGRLQSVRHFEELTGWHVLGSIPRIGRSLGRRAGTAAPAGIVAPRDPRRRRALHCLLDPHTAAAESFLMLRTQLEHAGVGGKYKSLMVTSLTPGEGKSSTLSNLAIAFAASGRETLLLDAEFRRPVIHTLFDVYKAPGLSDLLVSRDGNGSLSPPPVDGEGEAAAVAYQRGKLEHLTILTSGKRGQGETLALFRPRLDALLDDAARRYDVVLVDAAPLMMVHDAVILASVVDAVLFVVDAETYDEERVLEAKSLLQRSGATVLGAVINRLDRTGRYRYYYHTTNES